LAGAWIVFGWLLAPPVPDPQVATVEEVADFLSHKRGLARLPVQRRKEVLGRTLTYYSRDPVRREMLADRIEQMAPRERVVIREAVFEIVKEDFITDAKEFLKLPEEKKEKFVEQKLEEYESVRQEYRGRDGARNIGESFMNDPGVPSRSDAFAKAIVTRTTARERAMAKPYADKISQLVEQRQADSKKQKKKAEWWKG
jgi:hypothetical protein